MIEEELGELRKLIAVRYAEVDIHQEKVAALYADIASLQRDVEAVEQYRRDHR